MTNLGPKSVDLFFLRPQCCNSRILEDSIDICIIVPTIALYYPEKLGPRNKRGCFQQPPLIILVRFDVQPGKLLVKKQKLETILDLSIILYHLNCNFLNIQAQGCLVITGNSLHSWKLPETRRFILYNSKTVCLCTIPNRFLFYEMVVSLKRLVNTCLQSFL